MGWSCTRLAGDAADRLTTECVKATGSQNHFVNGGRSFFWEIDRVEHDDGRITGEWYEEVGSKYCVERGKFTILPKGTMADGHPWMRMMCR